MRRRFALWQRQLIYSAAGGLCESCGEPLDIDWQADHLIPFSKGGTTETCNGRAMCPRCNKRKADKVDEITLWPHQRDLTETVMARIAAGERETCALIPPGMGKTRACINTAQECYRERVAPYFTVGLPRLNLQGQFEDDFLELRGLYVPPRLNKLSTRGNGLPLVRADENGSINTYASYAVNGGKVHLEWARAHRGQFIAFWDETQFLGAADADGGGFQSAKVVQEIASYALHNVCVTGYPYRSDRRRLIFGDYSDPDPDGNIHYISHIPDVTARRGIAMGILRPFEAHLSVGDGRFKDGEEYDIEAQEDRLGEVTLHTDNWQPVLDDALDHLSWCKRNQHPAHKGAVAGVHMGHAETMYEYARQKHNSLRHMLVTSDQGPAASKKLRDFRETDSPWDVVFSVGMVYIGFDCKPITVVCNLSAKRWPGWLAQFCARGERMWPASQGGPEPEGQRCYYFGLRDPFTIKWVEEKRGESDAGLREREDHDDGGGGGGGSTRTVFGVEQGTIKGAAAYGLHEQGDLEPAELAGLQTLLTGLNIPATDAAALLRRAGHDIPTVPLVQPCTPPPERSKDQRKRQGNRFQGALNDHLRIVHALTPGIKERYASAIREHAARLNGWQGVPLRGGADYLTESQWDERIGDVEKATANGECPWPEIAPGR